METQHEPDIAEAKASMFEKLDELSRRFQTAKSAMNLKGHIEANPQLAAGIALGVGLLLGARGARNARTVVLPAGSPEAAARAGLLTGLLGLVGGLVFRLAKDAVVRELSGYAKDWLENQNPREATASRPPETAAFLRH